jgi:hypothetical protein
MYLILANRYRSDARTVVAAIRFVVDELCRSHHNLFVRITRLFEFCVLFISDVSEVSVAQSLFYAHLFYFGL